MFAIPAYACHSGNYLSVRLMFVIPTEAEESWTSWDCRSSVVWDLSTTVEMTLHYGRDDTALRSRWHCTTVEMTKKALINIYLPFQRMFAIPTYNCHSDRSGGILSLP